MALAKNIVISDMKVTSLVDSNYVKPIRLKFEQNGRSRTWDMVRSHDSVIIVIFNLSRQVLVCVKQFRPSVYFRSHVDVDKRDATIDTSHHSPLLGITLEFCAGNVDKNKSIVEIAKEEVLEECGFDVPLKNLEKFKVCRDVGIEGCYQTFFYVEVTDDMKVSQGGGVTEEGEVIEVVEVTIPEAEAYLNLPENTSPPGFLFALSWFLSNKAPKYKVHDPTGA